MKTFISSLILVTSIVIYSQSPKGYASKIIEYLSSEDFAGRGYNANGLEKSADFIEKEFTKIGLQKFNNSYRQNLSYPINILDNAELSINGKKLKLGTDYIVSPFSKTEKGSFQPKIFNVAVFDTIFKYQDYTSFQDEIQRLDNQFVVFPTVDFPANYIFDGVSANDLYRAVKLDLINQEIGNIKGAIEIDPAKLTMSLSNEPKNTHLFTVLEDKLPKNIENVDFSVESHFNPAFKTDNLIGYIEGKNNSKKILITAHYDHLGQIGSIYFPGANDNASGIAMMLSLAKYFSKVQPKYTLVFMAFTGEEAGLQGSQYFVEHPTFDLNSIKLVCNFDIMGTGEDGIQIVNSVKNLDVYTQLNEINDKHQVIKQIKKRGEACNSDHCPFDRKGIPSIFTYTLGGVPYYHDVNDRLETLSLAEFDDIFFIYKTFFEEYK